MAPLVIYPEPAISTLTASGFSVPNPLLQYQVSGTTFSAGVYTITSYPTTSQATVTFNNSAGTTFQTTTISGTVTINLSFDSTNTYIYTDTGTNVVVTINNTAQSLTGVSLSGTLDTITSSGTYNQTGKMLVVAISGGQGGGSGGANQAPGWTNDEYGGGNGGYSGAWAIFGPGYVNTAQTVTIGAGGAGQPALTGSATGQREGSQGGTTSFGNLAVANSSNISFNKGTGGGASSGNNDGPSASIAYYKNVSNGTTGGGGKGATAGSSGSDNTRGGYGAAGPQSGAGSGIGTGGTGANNYSVAPTAATGYGAGGGGGYGRTSRWNGSAGSAGSQGVVYVLRGF